MTTVAWDGRTLAADRQITYGNTRAAGRKLYDCGNYVYAASGSAFEAELIAAWLRNGARPTSRVRLEDEEGHRCGIVIRKADGLAFVAQGRVVVLVGHRPAPIACGSGCDFALAAMAMGESAVQAVRFAERFDVYTGLGVDRWTLRGPRGRSREARVTSRRR